MMRRAAVAAVRDALSAAAEGSRSLWRESVRGPPLSCPRWAPPRPHINAHNNQWRSVATSASCHAAPNTRGGRGGKPGTTRGVSAPDGARKGTGKKPFKKATAAKGLPDRFAALMEEEESNVDGAKTKTETESKTSASLSLKKSSSSKKKQKQVNTPTATITLTTGMSVTELARKLKVEPGRVEKILTELGEQITSAEDSVHSPDVIELCAVELGVEDVEVVDVSDGKRVSDTHDDDPPRRAVVAVMGHVDHGKTTLLDSLRSTSVAAGEAGGITQHIGAFVVQLKGGGELTFLDTPGHAAFGAMRKRGAAVTDVAVLVCAADDGVMPQTREAAAHIIASGCRYVVALTKCDVEGADPDRVRNELIAAGIPLESSGGDIQSVEVSAVTGQGMEDLEMALFLEAETLGLTAPNSIETDGNGTVLEARLDKGEGAVVNGLLRRGVLSIGDDVVAGATFGRVRLLRNAAGEVLDSVGPSEPFELTGLRQVPLAGDAIQRVVSEDRARRVATARGNRIAAAAAAKTEKESEGRQKVYDLEHTHAPSGERGKQAAKKAVAKSKLRASGVGAREGLQSGLLEDEMRSELLGADGTGDPGNATQKVSSLNCVVKADVQGTCEAVRDSLLSLSTDTVAVKVVFQGTGAVTESDISLASAVGGVVLAFNVKHSVETEKHAKVENVTVVRRTVIYHLLDAVGEMLGGLAPEKLVEEIHGEAEVRQVFDLSDRRGNKANLVAGCVVNKGSFDSDEKFRVMRDGEVLHEGLLDVASIRRHRLEVRNVGKGTDCGVDLIGFSDIKQGDTIQCIKFVKKKATVEKIATGGARVVE